MKREVKTRPKDDGTYVETTTETITPEDGIIEEDNQNNPLEKNYKTGYQVNTHIETNDPRIIKPFLYGMCSIFYIIGIILIIYKFYIMGIYCFIINTITLISMLKDINKTEKELLKNPTYDPHDKTVIKEFSQTIKNDVKEAASKTFTKDTFKWFVKTAIPFYSAITITISLIISIVFGIILSSILYGILIFFGLLILFIIIAIIYFALVSLLFNN